MGKKQKWDKEKKCKTRWFERRDTFRNSGAVLKTVWLEVVEMNIPRFRLQMICKNIGRNEPVRETAKAGTEIWTEDKMVINERKKDVDMVVC